MRAQTEWRLGHGYRPSGPERQLGNPDANPAGQGSPAVRSAPGCLQWPPLPGLCGPGVAWAEPSDPHARKAVRQRGVASRAQNTRTVVVAYLGVLIGLHRQPL
jgi:hypothetical protein